ncbi:hypothetical protein YC2023_107590 [Brassica napus]
MESLLGSLIKYNALEEVFQTTSKKSSSRLQRSLPDDFKEVFQTTSKKSSRRLPGNLLTRSSSISSGLPLFLDCATAGLLNIFVAASLSSRTMSFMESPEPESDHQHVPPLALCRHAREFADGGKRGESSALVTTTLSICSIQD